MNAVKNLFHYVFRLFKQGAGIWGYLFNRVAGLGLLIYLFIHLAVLSLLLQGPATWNRFVALTKTPLFLTLDVILFAGVIGHGLNGLRIALLGSGILVPHQRRLLIGASVAGTLLWLIAIVLLFIQ
jgi:succinate dehydrogenase / fumarate reductase cytochrome b subunit